MNYQQQRLPAGLTFVGVPIGAARDITLRALDVLASAQVLAAEDTRSLRKLLDIHGVPLAGRRIVSLHEHSRENVIAKLVGQISEGASVAYASEAGMPLIADPGFELARAVIEEGLPLDVAPGPSASLAALAVAGLPTDAFFFAGFLPSSKGARAAALEGLRDVPGTLILYESPKRVAAMLGHAAEVLGVERPAAVCRELTKKFQEVRRGTLASLAAELTADPPKGEIVVLVGREHLRTVSELEINDALIAALKTMTVRDAAVVVAQAHGLPRRRVYQAALALEKER